MSTIFSVQSTVSQCHRLFIEPYKQGVYNIRDGLNGKRIEAVNMFAEGALVAVPTTRAVPLSLAQRVAAFVIGSLLLVPIVNALAMYILKRMSSNNLYAPLKEPVAEHVRPNTPAGPTNPTVSPPVIPLTPEQMVQRKTQALARLAQIEAMGGNRATNFDVNSSILSFNLDAILQRFPANQNPSQLCSFLNWAGVDPEKQRDFRRAVEQFDGVGPGQQRHAVVKDLLSRLNSYFTQRRAIVTAGSTEETNLKLQYIRNVDKIVDANRNCIDQMLSQVQEIMLDIAGDAVIGIGGNNPFVALQARAGHALCKYRANLLRDICVRQNPGEAHMADLERIVMQRLASMLGMDGSIFNAGAHYAGIINDADGKAERAANEFLAQYKPLEFLTNELRTTGNATVEQLRNLLLRWSVVHYDVANEDTDRPQAATDMNRRLSANFDPDSALDFENGGELTPAAVFFILEATQLIRAR